MYDIVKYLREVINGAKGHLIQSYKNTKRKRNFLNFNKEFKIEDNENNDSTDISLDFENLEWIDSDEVSAGTTFMVQSDADGKIKKIDLGEIKAWLEVELGINNPPQS